MDGPSDKVFPHAAFPADQDCRVSTGDVRDDCPDRPHLRAFVDQWVVVVVGETTLSNILLCQRPVS